MRLSGQAVLFCSVLTASFFVRNASSFISLNEQRQFVDREGRQRVYHGMNVVYKSPPWLPITTHFDPQLSFSTKDMELLQSWGLNVIRLGFMWPGVEPERDQFNLTYLQAVRDLVTTAATYNISVLLDVHQDSLSRLYCGEGLPSWAVLPGVSKKMFDNFPAPFGKPLARDPSTLWPSIPDCHKTSWSTYQTTFAGALGYQNLYDSNSTNPAGMREAFANFWRRSAQYFADLPSVIGFELINEPFAGNFWKKPLGLLPWEADKENLQPFYDDIVAAIRTVNKHHLVMFEPVTFSGQPIVNSGTTGFERSPNNDSQSVLAFHYYNPPNFGPTESYFARRLEAAKRLNVGAFVTEFGIDNHLEVPAMDEMDSLNGLSWILWEYKSFAGSLANGTCTGCGRGPIFTNGTIDMSSVMRFTRTYAQAVAGSITATSFNATTADFSLEFTSNPSVTAPTVVYVPESLRYPSGVSCTVSPSTFSCSRADTNQYHITATSSTTTGTAMSVSVSISQQ